MLNMIRSDIYRLLRHKGIWILTAIIIGYAAFIIVPQSISDISMPLVYTPDAVMNGINSTISLFGGAVWFMLFLVPIVTILCGQIFQDSTVKNEVSYGFSRTKIYVTRLIEVTMMVIIFYTLYIAFGMGLATVLNGWGGPASPVFWTSTLSIFGLQLLNAIATSWIGIFLIFTIKSGYVFTEVYIGVMFLPQVIWSLLSVTGLNLGWLLYFDLMANMAGIAQYFLLGSYLYAFPQSSLTFSRFGITFTIMFGGVWMLITTVLGLLRFNSIEVK